MRNFKVGVLYKSWPGKDIVELPDAADSLTSMLHQHGWLPEKGSAIMLSKSDIEIAKSLNENVETVRITDIVIIPTEQAIIIKLSE